MYQKYEIDTSGNCRLNANKNRNKYHEENRTALKVTALFFTFLKSDKINLEYLVLRPQ